MRSSFKTYLERFRSWLSRKINDAFSDKHYIPIIDREKPWIIKKYLLVAGNIYHFYKTQEEFCRVFFYNFRADFTILQILLEIGIHTRKLLLLTLLTFIIPFSLYFSIGSSINFSLSAEAIRNLLLGQFAGITALLGIIFAFYSVGFQIAIYWTQ
jgi:hypothetical protein